MPLAQARPSLELTAAEESWLRDHPVWRISSPSAPPFSWQEPAGRWQGLNEDFIHIIKDRLGIKVEYIPVGSPSESLQRLQSGVCDASFLIGSPVPEPNLPLSNEFLRLPVAVVIRTSTNNIESFEDLGGKIISVLQGRSSHEKLAQKHPEILLKPEADPKEALAGVSRGDSDAFVGDLATALYLMKEARLNDLRIATYAPYSFPFRLALRPDWAPAVSILNKVTASMDDERQALREKWITPDNDGFSARQIMRVALPVVVVFCILLLVASNWRLKNAVALRTEELQEAMARVANQNTYLDTEVARRTKEIEAIKDATILALAAVAETRDTDTGAHLRRTQLYVRTLAAAAPKKPQYTGELTEEVIGILYKTAPLHDIGKVGIPDNILLKPDKLTKEEFEIMKSHVVLGGKAIAAAERQIGTVNSFMRYAREIVTTHHEKWDGTGYPAGLQGNRIPLAGRIMAIADVYDALRTKRVYKDAVSHEEAVKIISEGRGSHFDPGLVDVFMENHENFRRICAEYADRV